MDQPPRRSPRQGNLRTVLTMAVVLALVYWAQAKDVFQDFTRPTVILALHLLGIGASDHGATITVGRLEIPWTRDCAGLNLLLVLLALTIWVNRSEPFGWRYVAKILAAVPAALVANVLRVLTLIAYREAFFPAVESQQLHYFLGLVWLMPFLAAVIPRGGRPVGFVIVETFQAAAVIALLAPMSGAPGVQLLGLAALVGLVHSRTREDALRVRSLLMVPWLLAAAAIAVLGVESFWLPWLLVCPLLADGRWLRSLPGIVLMENAGRNAAGVLHGLARGSETAGLIVGDETDPESLSAKVFGETANGGRFSGTEETADHDVTCFGGHGRGWQVGSFDKRLQQCKRRWSGVFQRLPVVRIERHGAAFDEAIAEVVFDGVLWSEIDDGLIFFG